MCQVTVKNNYISRYIKLTKFVIICDMVHTHILRNSRIPAKTKLMVTKVRFTYILYTQFFISK